MTRMAQVSTPSQFSSSCKDSNWLGLNSQPILEVLQRLKLARSQLRANFLSPTRTRIAQVLSPSQCLSSFKGSDCLGLNSQPILELLQRLGLHMSQLLANSRASTRTRSFLVSTSEFRNSYKVLDGLGLNSLPMPELLQRLGLSRSQLLVNF